MNKWQWLHHHMGGRARSTDRVERLHRLREAFNKIHAYILSQDGLSDEHKDTLVAIVEGVIGAALKEEAADYIRRLVEDRINEPLSGITLRVLEHTPFGIPGEIVHVGSGSLVRTTRQRTRSARTGRPSRTTVLAGEPPLRRSPPDRGAGSS